MMGNKLLFPAVRFSFPGNNEFYYFDNKIINQALMMVVKVVENTDEGNQTYFASSLGVSSNYQYQPDVNGAFYSEEMI